MAEQQRQFKRTEKFCNPLGRHEAGNAQEPVTQKQAGVGQMTFLVCCCQRD